MVDYDNSGRIKDLFQTFPQALNHEIDDLHRGLLAHFFSLSFFHYQWQAEVLPHWLPTSSPPPNITLPLFDRVLVKKTIPAGHCELCNIVTPLVDSIS